MRIAAVNPAKYFLYMYQPPIWGRLLFITMAEIAGSNLRSGGHSYSRFSTEINQTRQKASGGIQNRQMPISEQSCGYSVFALCFNQISFISVK